MVLFHHIVPHLLRGWYCTEGTSQAGTLVIPLDSAAIRGIGTHQGLTLWTTGTPRPRGSAGTMLRPITIGAMTSTDSICHLGTLGIPFVGTTPQIPQTNARFTGGTGTPLGTIRLFRLKCVAIPTQILILALQHSAVVGGWVRRHSGQGWNERWRPCGSFRGCRGRSCRCSRSTGTAAGTGSGNRRDTGGIPDRRTAPGIIATDQGFAGRTIASLGMRSRVVQTRSTMGSIVATTGTFHLGGIGTNQIPFLCATPRIGSTNLGLTGRTLTPRLVQDWNAGTTGLLTIATQVTGVVHDCWSSRNGR